MEILAAIVGAVAAEACREAVMWARSRRSRLPSVTIEPREEPLRCANCGREPRPDENAEDEWRAASDGLGELHVFCAECWEREFGQRDA